MARADGHKETSMAEAKLDSIRTDGLGREFVCESRSPDGGWHVEVFGPNESSNGLYAYARQAEFGTSSFGLGREPVGADRITFRWDLPNGSWGIFIDGECWAIYTNRAALRMGQQRIHNRSGAYARPYTEQEIRFTCAKRRGQRKGVRGFVIEE
ncbi:unnamed protein product [uncultured bacterium]|nr:unnamed protein product [uncultured bacterium]